MTVRAEPLPADEWLSLHLSRARVSFGSWSPEAHEMLVAPEAAALAGRPAVHIRYRLLGNGPEDEPPQDEPGPVPASLVEHWTVLVEERRWLLALELVVQPRSAGTRSARRSSFPSARSNSSDLLVTGRRTRP